MRASRKAQGRRLSGNNPGEGPDFVDLADRMLKHQGTMAFVLPVTAITGSSWQKVRKMWAKVIDVIRCLYCTPNSEKMLAFQHNYVLSF